MRASLLALALAALWLLQGCAAFEWLHGAGTDPALPTPGQQIGSGVQEIGPFLPLPIGAAVVIVGKVMHSIFARKAVQA